MTRGACRGGAESPVGIILAGGQARRMGGGDKGLLATQAGTLLGSIVDRLAPQCAALLLSANGDARRFARYPLTVVPDHPEDEGAGPIAGVLAGLDTVASLHPHRGEALTVPTDTPLIPVDLAVRLGDARRRAGVPVALARSGGRDHPVVALWAVDTRHALRRLLRVERERRLGVAQSALGRIAVCWSSEHPDPFLNVNTPADFAGLQSCDAPRSGADRAGHPETGCL